MKTNNLQLPKISGNTFIAEEIEGMLAEIELALDRIFQAEQSPEFDRKLLRRLVHTHLSRSKDSLIILVQLIEAHQKGYLDNILLISLAMTS